MEKSCDYKLTFYGQNIGTFYGLRTIFGKIIQSSRNGYNNSQRLRLVQTRLGLPSRITRNLGGQKTAV
jgi:hypothetical protein